jgi:outer membrane protein TolC
MEIIKMTKKSIMAIAVLLCSGSAIAQQVNSLSAKQAVGYALKNAVEVKNALLNIEIQKQTNREFTSAAYPQINGKVGSNYYPNIGITALPNFISPVTYDVLVQNGVKNGNGDPIVSPPLSDFGFINAQFGTKFNAQYGVDISQLLFDGQVFVGLQARDALVDYAIKQTAVTEQTIKVNVLKIYYQLVVGVQQMTTIDANIERFEKLLFETSEIYKNGFAEKLDVDRVNVQLNNLRTEKLRVENTLAAGNASLKFLMNMPQKDTLILTDKLTDEDLKSNLLDTAYNYSDRRDFQMLEVGKQLKEFNVRRYKLSYLPSISLNGNYFRNAQRNEFSFFGESPAGQPWFSSSLVGVSINVPIFDGFAKAARVSRAKLELQQTNNSIDQLKASIDRSVVTSRIALNAALLTMDNQRKNMELAEKVLNATNKKYAQGVGSSQEIYTAQTALKTAQNNYYGSLYDAVIAKIDYLNAIGK